MNTEIIDIFKKDLKSDKGSDLDIESLISARRKARTDYKPYYQRNYVWMEDKASYLIESILLGYQIPPIILFSRNNANGKEILEIIDGRQRYETIIKFVENEISLTDKGLQTYEKLDKQFFNDLDNSIQDKLLSSKITLVKYNLSNYVNPEYEDYIIKEIFRRYNSGITKMKTIDNERAEYINHNLISFFERYIQENKNLYYTNLSKLFFAEKKQNDLESNYRDAIEELKKAFRKFYVIHLCPIKKYLSKPILLKNIFDSLDNENDTEENLSSIIENFDFKIKLIYRVIEPLINQDYFFKINKELTLVFYWALSILEQEKIDINLLEKYKKLIINEITNENNYLNFQVSDIDYMHKPYKFELIIQVINKILERENIEIQNDLSEVYIYNKNFGFTFENDINEKLENDIRVHKEEIVVDTFIKHIKRGKYLIRPQYQRNEVINLTKSSGIIESLLLDIKLPPIFVYKRKDDVSEIIDGQQRLLSILGFLGEKYQNEAGKLEETKKSNYKLTGLKILNELNNSTFNNLTDDYQDVIYDSSLTIIKITEEDNPEFDPISLFLRLNLKPYPIDENSFEMWNSYLDKNITDYIKINSEKSYFQEIAQWAYFKKNDKRMENEEIYTILAYIDYQVTNKNVDLLETLDIHMKNEKLIVRLQLNLNKQYTTKALRDRINYDSNEKNNFIKSLKNIKQLFEKIEMLLLVLDENKNSLRKTLDKVTQNKGLTRKKYTFYLLYVLLSQIPKSMVLEFRNKGMIGNIQEFFEIINDDNIIVDESEYRARIENFINKYTPNKRDVNLSEIDIDTLMKNQNNLCPLCNNEIFTNDKTHIDHIVPISKGGNNKIENLQIVHEVCNLKKGNKN